jgi:hypothetical protein
MSSQSIRAEIIGATEARAMGLAARGHAPLFALCRLLIERGHDPARPLHAYRGDVLCLRVRSLGAGAGLTVCDSRHGTPKVRRWVPAAGDVAAPPVAWRRRSSRHAGRHALV